MSAAADPRLRVVLCWHLHQPQYRDLATGRALRPWVYLHALRDYVDLAVRLESAPGVAAVVCFSPLMLEQLDDYCAELAAHARHGAPLGDPLLALLAAGGVPADRREWPALVRACLSAHRVLQVERHEPYRRLADLAARLLEQDALDYATPELLTDLAAWFHLAWCGESVRAGDPRAAALVAQGRGFSRAQLAGLLDCVADALASVVPRFRRLAGNGQVELAVSPWGHPILPLLLGFGAAHEAEPGLVLPPEAAYPGGEDRARWHLARALQVFSRHFGLRPRGLWPPEGALSDAALALLPAFGLDWVASGEGVLRRSHPAPAAASLHRAYAVGRGTSCFFRDDELSDRVGFTYGRWEPAAAAADLVARLERLAAEAGPEAVVPLVLDGDNALEFHAHNGQDFVAELYARLADHPRLRTATFSQCLAEGIAREPLPRLVAGSWIRGSLANWIGNAGRNRAWAGLCEAKRSYDQVVVEGSLDERAEAAAEVLLGVCEASDWFWRFDDEDDEHGTLDPLFRRHLLNLYATLGEAPPAALAAPGAERSVA